MSTALRPDALNAIKALVGVVLQRERDGVRTRVCQVDAVPIALRKQLDAVPQQALLATIRRHRLECLMRGDPLVAELLPDLQPTIQALSRQEAMAALALAGLTREMARLFDQAEIPLLVIKGIPLALQTTGLLTARGRGDLDLLVDPRRLPDTIELLESCGFERLPGYCPRNLHSFWGRYSRWAGYELPLQREATEGRQMIDLHWVLSNVRSPLPSFNQAWCCKSVVEISGQSVSTLGPLHAFQHACAHAAKDQWMCLRNLIDIDRLAHLLSIAELSSLRRQPMVHQSCAVAYEISASDGLQRVALPHQPGAKRALCRASRNQRLSWRSQGTAAWNPGQWASLVGRQLGLSYAVEDWIRTLLYFIVLPAAFSDPVTGKDRSLRGFLLARMSHLRQRFLESASGNPATSVAQPASHSIPVAPASKPGSAHPAGKESRSR